MELSSHFVPELDDGSLAVGDLKSEPAAIALGGTPTTRDHHDQFAARFSSSFHSGAKQGILNASATMFRQGARSEESKDSLLRDDTPGGSRYDGSVDTSKKGQSLRESKQGREHIGKSLGSVALFEETSGQYVRKFASFFGSAPSDLHSIRDSNAFGCIETPEQDVVEFSDGITPSIDQLEHTGIEAKMNSD